MIGAGSFDVSQIMVLIRERIYSQNSSNRRFIVSWVGFKDLRIFERSILSQQVSSFVNFNLSEIDFKLSALLTAPEISILEYIPEVLDGVFQMLGDPQPGLRDATEAVLGQFLESISSADEKDNVSHILQYSFLHFF